MLVEPELDGRKFSNLPTSKSNRNGSQNHKYQSLLPFINSNGNQNFSFNYLALCDHESSLLFSYRSYLILSPTQISVRNVFWMATMVAPVWIVECYNLSFKTKRSSFYCDNNDNININNNDNNGCWRKSFTCNASILFHLDGWDVKPEMKNMHVFTFRYRKSNWVLRWQTDSQIARHSVSQSVGLLAGCWLADWWIQMKSNLSRIYTQHWLQCLSNIYTTEIAQQLDIQVRFELYQADWLIFHVSTHSSWVMTPAAAIIVVGISF